MVNMKKYEYTGFFVICAISLLIAWLFISNPISGLLGLFFPLNSSLWEISKLMFTSILIYSIYEYFVFGKRYGNFWFAKASSMLFGPMIYIFLSYLLDVSIGTSYAATHLITFAFSVALAQYISYNFMQYELYFKLINAYGIVAIIALFTIFTIYNGRTNAFSGAIFEPMEQYQKTINYM